METVSARGGRNIPVDIARGLCILSMVVVHAFNWWGICPGFNAFTGVFFLVFFFFASGLVRPETTQIGKYLRRQFLYLELPYLAFTAFYVIYACFIGKYFPDQPFSGLLRLAFSGWIAALPGVVTNLLFFPGPTFGIGPIWFLNCMFFSNLLYVCLRRLKQGALLSLLMAALAVFSQRYVTLPFALQDACIGCALIFFGALVKNPVRRWLGWMEEKAFFVSLLFTAASGALLYLAENTLPDQWFNLGGNLYHPQSLPSTCLGFVFILSLAVLIRKLHFLDDFLRFAGQRSYFILLLHNLDILLLRNWSRPDWYFLLFTLLIYPLAVHVLLRVWNLISARFGI